MGIRKVIIKCRPRKYLRKEHKRLGKIIKASCVKKHQKTNKKRKTGEKRRKLKGKLVGDCGILLITLNSSGEKMPNPVAGRTVTRFGKTDRLGKLLSPHLHDFGHQETPSDPAPQTPSPIPGLHPAPRPLGIRPFRNTCFLNSAVMLMKNIPGLQFQSEDFKTLYETSPELIDETMVKKGAAKCPAMRYGRQEDSMELVIRMTEDVINKEKFLAKNGIKFHIQKHQKCYPLLSYIDEMNKTRAGPLAESIRITGVEERLYRTIQEIITGISYENEGITIDYGSSEFSPMDFIEHSGIKLTLEDLYQENGNSWMIPSCTKQYFEPVSEYIIVHLDTIDTTRGIKANTRIHDILADLVFTSGGYKPISFVTHVGNMNAGHYINYSLTSGKWYEFDDGLVTDMQDGEFKFRGTPSYLLYRRF